MLSPVSIPAYILCIVTPDLVSPFINEWAEVNIPYILGEERSVY